MYTNHFLVLEYNICGKRYGKIDFHVNNVSLNIVENLECIDKVIYFLAIFCS